jgi:phosphate/sulfate permease
VKRLLTVLALTALLTFPGCYALGLKDYPDVTPDEHAALVEEIKSEVITVVTKAPELAVNPTNIPTWIEVGGAIALIIGGAVGGPAAARKVKKVLGK